MIINKEHSLHASNQKLLLTSDRLPNPTRDNVQETDSNSISSASSTSFNIHTLRETAQAIQAAHQKLGIQSQAAMPFDPLSLAIETKIALGIASWVAAAFGHKAAKFLNEKVIKPMGNYWNDALLHENASVREKAINDIIEAGTKGDIEDARKLTQSVEFALREFSLRSLELYDDDLSKAKQTIRGLITALEALYQIELASPRNNIYLDNRMSHGWQDHSTVMDVILTGTKAISYIATLKFLSDSGTKAREGNLTEQKKWYEYDNACNLVAALLEDCYRGKFPAIDDIPQESLRRILVRNWKVPVTVSESSSAKIQGSKIPETTRSKAYRLHLYETMESCCVRDDVNKEKIVEDPLYLSTEPPPNLNKRVADLRNGLVSAYQREVGFKESNSSNCSKAAIPVLGKILENATAIPRHKWNETARKAEEIRQQNIRKCDEFTMWAHIVPKTPDSEPYNVTELRKVFAELTQDQIDNLPAIREFFTKDKLPSAVQLNSDFANVLVSMNLLSQEEGEKLTQKNDEKGLFFFRYLNGLMDKEVTIGTNPPSLFKNQLSSTNRQYILEGCKTIVHDAPSFQGTTRDFAFFTNPSLTSVPGQALTLHHKLTFCFNDEGYVDIYGLKDPVVRNATRNMYPSGEKDEQLTGGFVFSGPQGTGKSSFGIALANQLAVPLVALNREMIKIDGEDISVVLPSKEEITLGVFFEEAKAIAPCVLLMDEVEKILVPRGGGIDPGWVKEPTPEQELLTTQLLTKLQEMRDEKTSASKVILVMTTNQPATQKIDLDSIDKQGESPTALLELHKHVSSTGIRDQRLDRKVFSFHELYTVEQAKALAKRFLGPYIRSGKIKEPSDYIPIAQVLMNYTPANIKTAFSKAAEEHTDDLTIEPMLSKLGQIPNRAKLRENTELMHKLESKVNSLVSVDQVKQLSDELDYAELAQAALGLSPQQIKTALEDLTPETLTQENILAAFEQVKNQ